MSILFRDDPSFYNTSELSQRYVTVSNATVLTTGVGRWGGNCWHQSGVGGFLSPIFAASATLTSAIDYFYTSQNDTQVDIVSWYDSGSIQCSLRVLSTKQIQFFRGGTAIGSPSVNVLTPATWYRIEAQVTINNATGSVEARVAGSSTNWIPPTASLNTRSTANNSANQAAIGNTANGGSGGVFNFGNFIVTDSNSPNAGFLGDKRIFLMLPSSNSSVAWTPTFAAFTGSLAMVVGQQIKDSNGNVQRVTIAGTTAGSAPSWATTGGGTTTSGSVTFTVVGSGANPGATNWMAVSETPADGDSSYNASSNPTDIDLFGLSPALAVTTQNIAEAGAVLYARKDDAGVRSIASLRKSSTSTATGSTVALNSTYGFIDQIVEVDPNTSSAWTVSGVNASLVGYDEIA